MNKTPSTQSSEVRKTSSRARLTAAVCYHKLLKRALIYNKGRESERECVCVCVCMCVYVLEERGFAWGKYFEVCDAQECAVLTL